MNTRVRQWGNSLAIRIPRAVAEKVGLEPDDEVEIIVRNGLIILAPQKIHLDDLLDDVTSENRHPDSDAGADMGNEGW